MTYGSFLLSTSPEADLVHWGLSSQRGRGSVVQRWVGWREQ